jgi:VWFA-related protein
MASTFRSVLVVVVVSSLLLAGDAAPRAQDQSARPTFRTGADYVRVDVYPTRNGTPVGDLTGADFEILEDKVPQKIEQFEHIVVRAAGPQDTRREPNTIAESRQAALDPRARVFVLFLDIGHVEMTASRAIRTPLIEALDRLIGQDDLLAVMTPEMSARDVTFARRTTAIEGFLSRYWWGERDLANFRDPNENLYALCYPGIPRPGETTASDQGIAQEMILRRREKQTLEALEDLVRFLGGVREERKAIIAITDGWRLYEPNAALARPIDGPPRLDLRSASIPVPAHLPRGHLIHRGKRQRPIASATVLHFHFWMTRGSSDTCSTKRTARMHRSIQSIPAVSPCSTTISCPPPASAWASMQIQRSRRPKTVRGSLHATHRCERWAKRPTAWPLLTAMTWLAACDASLTT